jgi:hypothetical protein
MTSASATNKIISSTVSAIHITPNLLGVRTTATVPYGYDYNI